jgi:hypothetical protein
MELLHTEMGTWFWLAKENTHSPGHRA